MFEGKGQANESAGREERKREGKGVVVGLVAVSHLLYPKERFGFKSLLTAVHMHQQDSMYVVPFSSTKGRSEVHDDIST